MDSSPTVRLIEGITWKEAARSGNRPLHGTAIDRCVRSPVNVTPTFAPLHTAQSPTLMTPVTGSTRTVLVQSPIRSVSTPLSRGAPAAL